MVCIPSDREMFSPGPCLCSLWTWAFLGGALTATKCQYMYTEEYPLSETSPPRLPQVVNRGPCGTCGQGAEVGEKGAEKKREGRWGIQVLSVPSEVACPLL